MSILCEQHVFRDHICHSVQTKLLKIPIDIQLNCAPDEENCQGKFNRSQSDYNKIFTGCPDGTFACLTGHCIAQGWVCDRENDCMDALPGRQFNGKNRSFV